MRSNAQFHNFYFHKNSLREIMNIQNKIIVVTGGTSGIGLELVKQLYEHNTLIVISRSGNRLSCMLEQFPMIHVFPCDLANHQALESTTGDILKAHPEIDLLINNAAVQNTPSYLDDTFNLGALRAEIALNLTAICSLSYLLLPALLNSNHKAVICNINSGLPLAPKTSSAVYCATKAAMNAFSISLRYQLESTNVVNQAFLHLVDTAMTWGRGKINSVQLKQLRPL